MTSIQLLPSISRQNHHVWMYIQVEISSSPNWYLFFHLCKIIISVSYYYKLDALDRFSFIPYNSSFSSRENNSVITQFTVIDLTSNYCYQNLPQSLTLPNEVKDKKRKKNPCFKLSFLYTEYHILNCSRNITDENIKPSKNITVICICMLVLLIMKWRAGSS